jgi:hypothetical protein
MNTEIPIGISVFSWIPIPIPISVFLETLTGTQKILPGHPKKRENLPFFTIGSPSKSKNQKLG